MANEIKTRILLKYDSYTNWEASEFILKKGEAAVCEMSNTVDASGEPTILVKYGNGEDKFVDLPWTSALAADVYAWAKQSPEDFIKWVNQNIERPDIDTGIHAVDLATGATNGTVKLTVDGADKEVAVAGLQDAAYATVASLNATAKGYADAVEDKLPTELGVMSVANADDTIVVGGDGKNVTIKVADNKFDAYGAAAVVLGENTDGAAANTVYGAKAAAAAAQNDATIAKTKIETFLGTITPDGSKEIIDTLTEINNYVGEHGEEFAALSEKVTNIENGTTVVSKASDADTLDGKQAADFADATENGAKALAQGVKDVVDANKETWDKAGTALQAADLNGYAKTTEVTEAIEGAIEGEVARADGAYAPKTATAQGIENANAAAEAAQGTANNAKSLAEAALPKATAETDYLKKTDAATTYRAKQDKIIPADLSEDVFIFDCGNATKNID